MALLNERITSGRSSGALADPPSWNFDALPFVLATVTTFDTRPPDAARFGALFEAHERAVLAYTRRRTTNLADAEDAAAETFGIAWRRIASVPIEPLPWLYGVARRVLANQRRGEDRRLRLAWRIRDDVPTPTYLGENAEAPAMVALTRLRADDQELLRLVAWEELGSNQIAEMLGATPNAIAIRLHRARARFAKVLADIHGERGVKDPTASRTHGQVKGTVNNGAGTEGP